MKEDQLQMNPEMEQIQEEPEAWPMHPLNRWTIAAYEHVVNELRGKDWMTDFPKGGDLLTYLYNILLEVESDPTSVNLVKNLFHRALKPYLSWISHFIYWGEFNDPFGEFYIRRIDDHWLLDGSGLGEDMISEWV